jgi:hypothetical protein
MRRRPPGERFVSFEASIGLAYRGRSVSFAKRPDRNPPRWLQRRPSRVPAALFLRTALLGVIAIGGAAWALVRHYTHESPPMTVPVQPRPAPTYDADAGEFPVPDFETPVRP